MRPSHSFSRPRSISRRYVPCKSPGLFLPVINRMPDMLFRYFISNESLENSWRYSRPFIRKRKKLDRYLRIAYSQ